MASLPSAPVASTTAGRSCQRRGCQFNRLAGTIAKAVCSRRGSALTAGPVKRLAESSPVVPPKRMATSAGCEKITPESSVRAGCACATLVEAGERATEEGVVSVPKLPRSRRAATNSGRVGEIVGRRPLAVGVAGCGVARLTRLRVRSPAGPSAGGAKASRAAGWTGTAGLAAVPPVVMTAGNSFARAIRVVSGRNSGGRAGGSGVLTLGARLAKSALGRRGGKGASIVLASGAAAVGRAGGRGAAGSDGER